MSGIHHQLTDELVPAFFIGFKSVEWRHQRGFLTNNHRKLIEFTRYNSFEQTIK